MRKIAWKKKVLATAVLSLLFTQSGCSHLAENKKVADETVAPIEMIDAITDAYKKRENEKNNEYDSYLIAIDDGDLPVGSFGTEKKITADIKATAKDALDLLSLNYPELSIVYNLENPNALNASIHLKASSLSVEKYLLLIEKSSNLDIYFKDDILYVNDFVIVEGVISKIESGSKVHYPKIREYLSLILSSNSEQASVADTTSELSDIPSLPIDGIYSTTPVKASPTPASAPATQKPIIIIDEATGSLYIKASPNTLRQTKDLIQNYLNSIVSYASVELGIYRISNEKAREVGISVSKIIDNLYTLSAGTQADGIINKTMGFTREVTDNNGDVLKTGIQLYEKNGIVTAESSTILNVYNDVPTSMSDIQTTGYWIPGNLSENNTTINGASVVTYTEDKPEFVKEDVGKALIFTPRINLADKTINMNIEYSDSKIYATETFTWQRNLSIGDVIEIKKPLKSENKLSSTITLNNETYSLFAGFKSKVGSIERQFVPGLGNAPVLSDIGSNSVLGGKSDTVFVMKATFPEKQVVKVMTKKKNF